jgi:hypothetical protein
VLTLNLRNFRELAEAICAPTQQQRLDSRKYRAWIEGSVLRKSDDSIVGTWLDPPSIRSKQSRLEAALAVTSSAPPAGIGRGKSTLFVGQFASDTDAAKIQAAPIKISMTVITGMIIGIIGWWLYDATKPLTPVSHSNLPLTPPRARTV